MLLTNFCGFKKPSIKNLIPTTTSIEIHHSDNQTASITENTSDNTNTNNTKNNTETFANIMCIKKCRDELQHKPFSVPDSEFNRIVPLFQEPLLALGVPKQRMDNILNMRIADETTKLELAKKHKQPQFNHNLIPPIKNFFSREKELEELHDKLTKSENSGGKGDDDDNSKMGVVLCGYPGVGKSETARKYWFTYGKSSSYFGTVLWVDAENAATLESEFQDIADECGIKKTKNPKTGNYVEAKKLVDLVYRHFAITTTTTETAQPSPKKVLFVFDGADEPTIVKRFLPRCIDYAPYILITSQCTNWGSQFDNIEMNVFNTDDALQFFIKNTSPSQQYRDTVEIKKLLADISCHPLALQQAVSYIRKNTSTIKEYIALLEGARRSDMLSEQADPMGNPSVNSTMSVSIDRLKALNPDAVDLLEIMAHLDGMEIKKCFLMVLVNNDKFVLNGILTLLRKYAIINFDAGGANLDVPFEDQYIQIHSLTQLFLASKQSIETITSILQKITGVFISDLKSCEKTPDKPQDGRYWLNHFDKLCEHESKKSTMLNMFVEVGEQYQLRNLLTTKGRNRDLVDLCKFICEQQRQIRGELSGVYLKTRYQLARALYKFDRIEDAVEMLEETIDSQLQINDPSDVHPVIKSKIILAECLLRNGNSNKNTKDREQALQISMEVRDYLTRTNNTEHYLFSKTLNNIAFNYVCIGEFEKALQLFKHLKEIKFKNLELTNMRVRYSMIDYDMGYCYLCLERYEEAIDAFKQVTEKRLKCLGPDHYEYLKSKGRLAMSYQGNKEYEKAVQIFTEVEKVLLKTAGQSNQYYINFKNCHEMCLSEIKNLEEAAR